MSVSKWKDRWDVLTISNKHSVEMVEMKNKLGKVHEKPYIVHDYNDGMAGINRSNQMLSCYSGFWKSARWSKIGFHYIEIFVFNAHWLNTKFGKSKLSLLHFHPVVIKSLLGVMLSQSLQSSLSAPNFYYLKQFPQKRAIRKSIVVTNVSIVAWVVKKQIVVNQGFFVMVALKIQHYVLNHISSGTMKLSKI